MSSTPLAQAVQSTFAPGGPLAQAAEGFVARDGQTQLAQAVARTIGQGGVLVAEAATGVGKTFAYLVPALLSGERVLVSTATKTLQDQLFGRDLPRLARALGVPARMAQQLPVPAPAGVCGRKQRFAHDRRASRALKNRAMVENHAHR